MKPIYETYAGKLHILVYETREEMGRAAAKLGIEKAKAVIAEKGSVNAVFAAAPSQFELYQGLLDSDFDFGKMHAFHMDEYLGLPGNAPQGFGNLLKTQLFSKREFASVNYINGQTDDPESECMRYSQLLARSSPDIVFHGIGENGHLAFNDPPTANFEDPVAVKVVEMDEICRMQQVHDGCFRSLDEVPKRAITLTIPRLTFSVPHLIITVPGATKIEAVEKTVKGKVSTTCPASILKLHSDAVLFLDRVAAARIL
jgi:glucosamine-6-phosphate deaminase